jgi:hypothetical protein
VKNRKYKTRATTYGLFIGWGVLNNRFRVCKSKNENYEFDGWIWGIEGVGGVGAYDNLGCR